MSMETLPFANLYTWVKDCKSKYLDCNENLARILKLDSPHQIKGKTDYDFPWKEQAEFFIGVDALVMNNKKNYINAIELISATSEPMTWLVTKTPFANKNGKCLGVTGSNIDITGYKLVKNTQKIDDFNKKFYLGEEFDNEYLTKRETEVFSYILLGYSAKKIAICLKLSVRTVEGYIDNLKYKLQCNSKNEIISVAVKYGLTCLLNFN